MLVIPNSAFHAPSIMVHSRNGSQSHRSRSLSSRRAVEGVKCAASAAGRQVQNHMPHPLSVASVGKLFLDVMFGLFILYIVWVYICNRQKIDVTVDNVPFDPDSGFGSIIGGIKTVLIAAVSKRIGGPARDYFLKLLDAVFLLAGLKGTQVHP